MKAVITGDICNSTTVNMADLLGYIKDILEKIQELFGYKFEMFRGDSFQGIVESNEALIISLIIRSYLISTNQNIGKYGNKIDARIAIGIGEIEYFSESIGESNGTAFIYSGRTLEYMKKEKRHLKIKSDFEFDSELNTEFFLLDKIIDNWSPRQAEVIKLFLLGYNQSQIANELNISQSSISQRNRSANFAALEIVLNRYTILINKLCYE